MKFAKISLALSCALLLATMAAAQTKPWEHYWSGEEDKSFKEIFENWLDSESADVNEWLPVGSGVDGAQYLIRASDLINTTRVKPKVWIKTDYSETKTVRYRTMMSLFVFDCVAKTYSTLSQTAHMPDGSVGFNWKGYQTDYIVPDSVAEMWASRVCPK